MEEPVPAQSGSSIKSARLADELGLRGENWPILAALGEVYQIQGETEQAGQAFVRIAEDVELLVSRIEDERLRTLFLGTDKNRVHAPIEKESKTGKK